MDTGGRGGGGVGVGGLMSSMASKTPYPLPPIPIIIIWWNIGSSLTRHVPANCWNMHHRSANKPPNHHNVFPSLPPPLHLKIRSASEVVTGRTQKMARRVLMLGNRCSLAWKGIACLRRLPWPTAPTQLSTSPANQCASLCMLPGNDRSSL